MRRYRARHKDNDLPVGVMLIGIDEIDAGIGDLVLKDVEIIAETELVFYSAAMAIV